MSRDLERQLRERLAAVARHGGEGPAPPTPSSWLREACVRGLSVRQCVVVVVTKFRVICRAANRKPTRGLKCPVLSIPKGSSHRQPAEGSSHTQVKPGKFSPSVVSDSL